MATVARALPVAQPPLWAATLLGQTPRRSWVGSCGRRLIYEFVMPNRDRLRMVVPVLDDGRGFAWARATLQRQPHGGAPSRSSLAIEVTGGLREAIERDAWVVQAALRTQLPDRYTPSDTERRLAELLRPLSDVTLPLPDPAAVGPDADDPLVRGLSLCFLAVRRQWSQVFARECDPVPPWAAPVMAVLNGNLKALRQLADAHEGPAPRGAVWHLTGTAFGAAGHARVGARLLESALEDLQPQPRAAGLLQLAQLQRGQGKHEHARQMLRSCVVLGGADLDLLRRAALEFARVDAFEDAYAVLQQCHAQDPDDVAVALDFVGLLCSCGELDRAQRVLDRVAQQEPGRTELLRYRGAIAVQRGDDDRAVSLLRRLAQQDPADAEGRTWLCEALVRRGDDGEAQRQLDLARSRVDTVAHVLLQGALRTLGALEDVPDFVAVLAALGETANASVYRRSRARYPARAQALRALRALGGGRGHTLVRRDPSTPGPSGVRLLRVSWRGAAYRARQESSEMLKGIGCRPVGEVLGGFEELVARHPDSAHPRCYRGELHLWLGDYAAALADFDAALEVHPARWAFIGRAAVHALQGRPDAAREQVRRCRRHFDPVPSSTAHIYLGEMDRRCGELDRAIEQLEESVRVKPGRTSGWMNLALAYGRARRSEEAHKLFAQMCAQAPRLLWDARRWLAERAAYDAAWPPRFEDMDRLFEAALTMMQGNRSSHCVTYVDPDGVFRRVHDAEQWASTLDRMRFYLWAETCRRLLVGAR